MATQKIRRFARVEKMLEQELQVAEAHVLGVLDRIAATETELQALPEVLQAAVQVWVDRRDRLERAVTGP